MGRTKKTKEASPEKEKAVKKFAVMYHLDIGLEQIVEADTRDEALEKFREMLGNENACIKVYRPLAGFEPHVKVEKAVKI